MAEEWWDQVEYEFTLAAFEANKERPDETPLYKALKGLLGSEEPEMVYRAHLGETPVLLAFFEHDELRLIIHKDERTELHFLGRLVGGLLREVNSSRHPREADLHFTHERLGDTEVRVHVPSGPSAGRRFGGDEESFERVMKVRDIFRTWSTTGTGAGM